ncbi:MAG TPA: sigma-70 family RNA polymerase sigma factor [Tepidiformaceae bacterium]|nr:sigma-70 family RNA polymerase sigma factor [Tepidiformaceae bacterium]
MAWNGNPNTPGIRNIGRTVEFSRPAEAEIASRIDWPDEALMLAIVSRDEHAFSVLYDRYVDLVYSASFRVLADAQLAEDASQDVFVRLWRRPETFIAERGRFVSWLMSVTRNRAVDELRARGRRRKREGGPLGEPDEAAEPVFSTELIDPLHSAELHEEQATVRRALAALPREQKLCLELAYFGGLTQQEIAARLHEPLGTIKTRIRLGMQKLRRALDEKA